MGRGVGAADTLGLRLGLAGAVGSVVGSLDGIGSGVARPTRADGAGVAAPARGDAVGGFSATSRTADDAPYAVQPTIATSTSAPRNPDRGDCLRGARRGLV